YMVEIKGRSGPITVSIGPDFPGDQLGDLYEMIARRDRVDGPIGIRLGYI
ncbi:hypothetical protein, partial [Pseudomonas phage vB_Pae_BR141b]